MSNQSLGFAGGSVTPGGRHQARTIELDVGIELDPARAVIVHAGYSANADVLIR